MKPLLQLINRGAITRRPPHFHFCQSAIPEIPQFYFHYFILLTAFDDKAIKVGDSSQSKIKTCYFGKSKN